MKKNNKFDKKFILLFVLGIFLLLAFSFVITAKTIPNQHSSNISNNSSNNSIHNSNNSKLTYGICVSNITKDKTVCYKKAQLEYKNCGIEIRNLTRTLKLNNETINQTEIMSLKKECSTDYKTQLDSCKIKFKEQKDLCNLFKCKENQAWIDNKCVLK
jgi:NAD+--asparagine ADP-ribosyltransferase